MNLRKPIPSDPADWFDAGELDRARRYNRPLQVHAFIYGGVCFAAVLALILTHAAPRLIAAVGVRNWELQLLISLALIVVVVEIATVPLELWKNRYEERWKMRIPTGLRGWVTEQLQSIGLGIPLTALLVFPAWAVIRATHEWWIYAGGVVFLAYMVMSVLLTGFILRFMEKATLIDDEGLRRRVRRIAREAGAEVVDVYQSDESRRSPREGAYFIGFGKARRVVLFDNLLSRPHREIDVVLAEQISHIRRKHRLALGAALGVFTAVQFGAIRLIVGWNPILRAAGVSSVRDPGALPLVALLFSVTFVLVELAGAWITRIQKRVSDVDALEFTRDSDAFTRVIRGMYVGNLEDLAPSWWRRVRSRRPTPAEALALGGQWRATRRVTVLFTDIEDSTTLLERLGDEGWFDLRRDHNEMIRERIARHDGMEVDAAGDGFLIVFEDAGEAMLCAADCQRAFAVYNQEHPGIDLRVRMGLHAGDVIRKGREVVGREVHLAARIADLARGREILASSSVRSALEGSERFSFSDERTVDLKGFSESHTVWRVPWTDQPLLTTELRAQLPAT